MQQTSEARHQVASANGLGGRRGRARHGHDGVPPRHGTRDSNQARSACSSRTSHMGSGTSGCMGTSSGAQQAPVRRKRQQRSYVPAPFVIQLASCARFRGAAQLPHALRQLARGSQGNRLEFSTTYKPQQMHAHFRIWRTRYTPYATVSPSSAPRFLPRRFVHALLSEREVHTPPAPLPPSQ